MLKVGQEYRKDLQLWKKFLSHPAVYCRSFIDFSSLHTAEHTLFHTDASKNPKLVCGGWCNGSWFAIQWNEAFITQENPSIAYLEIYAVAVGVVLWAERFRNRRIFINCDNQAAVHMINNESSGCSKCLTLIRIITMESLIQNCRIYARYLATNVNEIADSLSRRQFNRFVKTYKKHAHGFKE